MAFESPDDVLEHFGVKGMRWGVQTKRSFSSGKSRQKRTAAQRKSRQERINKVVSGTILTAVAASYAVSIITTLGMTKTHDIPSWGSSDFGGSSSGSSYQSRTRSPTDIINQERDTQMSSLRRMHTEGKMDDAQLQNFQTKLNARYDRRVAEAAGR